MQENRDDEGSRKKEIQKWEDQDLEMLNSGFAVKKLTPKHVMAFRRGQSLGTASKGPSYDAWQLILGDDIAKRRGRNFDKESFLTRYPHVCQRIDELRTILKVHISPCMDIVRGSKRRQTAKIKEGKSQFQETKP